MDNQYLDKLVLNAVGKSNLAGAVINVSSGDGMIDFISSTGIFQNNSKYYIASINKIFMFFLILRLATNGSLKLDNKFADFLSDDVLSNLHVLNGKDYSRKITLKHLISQTSGRPYYLEDKQINGHTAIKDLEAGLDPACPLEKAIEEVKKMKPHFSPGEPGKAKYIDTNHQLLELFVEKVTGQANNQVLNNLFKELGQKR